jgi:phytoene desaturase
MAMESLIYKPGLSITDYVEFNIFKQILKHRIFRPHSNYVHKHFKSEKLRQILEFPLLFLGGNGSRIPSLYSIMNYADLSLGTWYPSGGMGKISDAFVSLAQQAGVTLKFNQEVDDFWIKDNTVKAIYTKTGETFKAKHFLGAGDYKHIESLLPESFRSYPITYWEKRSFTPNCILFFVGINKKLNKLNHHNLFFDADYSQHVKEIFVQPDWPTDPLFYVCAPSRTDSTVAPEGNENLFILVPLAPGSTDSEEQRESTFNTVLKRIEKFAGTFSADIIVKRDFGHHDFTNLYNAFKGNAYGLANTLTQTGFMKPKMKSKKLNNLFFCGQLTNPGPGLPPAIISGEIAASLITYELKKKKYAAI